jgi:hypothetical protein
MNAKRTRTISLSSKELDSAIEVLSSAAQSLQLTLFERLSYRALLISVDVAIVSCIVAMILLFLRPPEPSRIPEYGAVFVATMISIVAFSVSILVGIVSVALNIPLLRKAFRERTRLQQLGLSSLSQSLWKESRRSRWISRVRGALLIVVGVFSSVVVVAIFGAALVGEANREDRIALFSIALFWAIIAALMFTSRYLGNQRERMALTTDATELRKALQSLRQRVGTTGVVSVPSEFLEQTAKIESAQIAEQRKDAVLQSTTFRPNAYAVVFDRDATEQRATLGVADRVELEDLVAHFSTDGARLESDAGAGVDAKAVLLRATTESKRVEIEYVIDHVSHGIRIIAVRHGGDGSHAVREGG